MKDVLSAACVVMAFAVGAAAQAADPQSKAGGQKSEAAQERTVTVTGCLAAGEQPDSFVLSSVKWDDQKKHEGKPMPGAKPKPGQEKVPAHDPAEMKDASLRLIGAPPSLDLKAHLGHTVTLTGMLLPQAPEKATGTTGKETATAGAKARAVHSLNVKTMKHVSETCK